jgi:hypothetical protein
MHSGFKSRALLAARRNQIREHILVLAVVKAIAEFVQIKGQIFLADAAPARDYSAQPGRR